jgi:hypothetical protein
MLGMGLFGLVALVLVCLPERTASHTRGALSVLAKKPAQALIIDANRSRPVRPGSRPGRIG